MIDLHCNPCDTREIRDTHSQPQPQPQLTKESISSISPRKHIHFNIISKILYYFLAIYLFSTYTQISEATVTTTTTTTTTIHNTPYIQYKNEK